MQVTFVARPSALAVLVGVAFSQAPSDLPEGPSLWREVIGIQDSDPQSGIQAEFTRPHVPSYRSTADGRLAVRVKGTPYFTLLIPEKLDQAGKHLFDHTASEAPDGFGAVMSLSEAALGNAGYLGGSLVAARKEYVREAPNQTEGFWNVVHSCLWDDGPPKPMPDGTEVYSVKVIVTARCFSADCASRHGVGLDSVTRLFTTPVEVTVTNPKTAQASISAVVRGGDTIVGPILSNGLARPFGGIGFEPTVVDDGRLIVLRVGSFDFPDPLDPSGTMYADIIYSHYAGGDTADASQWIDFKPIAYAFSDTTLPPDLGFTRYPLRDATGHVIQGDEDLGGSYPWMDREAKNLFFTTLGTRLHEGDFPGGRYGLRVDPDFDGHEEGGEDVGTTRGVAFAGLWSRGKTIVIDTLHNDMDYAIGQTNGLGAGVGAQQRIVQLFEDGEHSPSASPISPGEIRLGFGRANAGAELPADENENTTIIDSVTNRLNAKKFVQQTNHRDVSWIVQNGKHTDELVFDEFTDPDALIVADMVGLVRHPVSGGNGNAMVRLEYFDGWSANGASSAWGTPGTHPIRLQNAATSHHRWNVPLYGELDHALAMNGGEARLEPTATGGIHGRGLWLRDGSSLRFAIPDQSTAPASQELAGRPMYVGIFFDARFEVQTSARRLLTFPDGSFVDVEVGEHIVLGDVDEQGNPRPLHYVDLPGPITLHATPGVPDTIEFGEPGAWTHLGLRVEDEGRRVTVLLNGMPLSRYAHPRNGLFRIDTPGDLVVGDLVDEPAIDGFRGWVDELRVLLHAVDPETACNLAGGTLMARTQAGVGTWSGEMASRVPEWADDEIDFELVSRGEDSFPDYLSLYDYTRDRPTFGALTTSGLVSLAQAIHFPEGPLFHDAFRPDSTTNSFCMTCHSQTEELGLQVKALAFDASMGVASIDGRRQPLQPPARIEGWVPPLHVDAGVLPGPPAATDAGVNTDEFMLDSFTTQVTRVAGASMIRSGTGEPVLSLVPGTSVAFEPALHGDGDFAFQGLLESAQNDVATSWSHTSGPLIFRSPLFLHSAAPYTSHKTSVDPFGGGSLSPGLYQFRVAPAAATAKTFRVVVPDRVPRVVASYRAAFRSEVPNDRWFYAWNEYGPVTDASSLASMNWDATNSVYDRWGDPDSPPAGDPLGLGSLSEIGGRPGNTTAGVDRYVASGFQLAATGHIAITGLDVELTHPGAANGNGVRVMLLIDRGNPTFDLEDLGVVLNSNEGLQPSSATHPVASGDVIWIAIGSNGNPAFDVFELDYDVTFCELAF